MPRIAEVCSSVFCPLEDVPHIGTPAVRELLRLLNRRIVGTFGRRFLSAVCLILFIFHSSSLIDAYARSVTPTLSGTVTDNAGAVMSDVNVAVISNAHGFQRPAITSAEGTFVVPQPPAGYYTVKAEHEPFSRVITLTPEAIVTPASTLNPQRANANAFTVDDTSVHVGANAPTEPVPSTQNNVILVVLKSPGATPGALQPELNSDSHSVALWLFITASIISLTLLLIRVLATDLQETILVLLRLRGKDSKEKKD